MQELESQKKLIFFDTDEGATAQQNQADIIPTRMLHRHLNHSDWTLAAIDDVIARGRLDDWKELRDVAASRSDVRERILRVAEPHLSDPYAQRYHFWNLYVRKQFA